MKRLIVTIAVAFLALTLFVLGVSGQGAGETLLAQVKPMLIDINQRVPISVTVLLPPNATQAQTMTLPLTIDFQLQIEVDNNAAVAVVAAEVPDTVVSLTESAPKPTPDQVVVTEIDAPTFELDQNKRYTKSFWLDDLPMTGSFLVVKARNSCCANPIWLNGNLIGSTAQIEGQEEVRLFVPPSFLNKGENEIVFIASISGYNRHGSRLYEPYKINKIDLMLNAAPVPTLSEPKDWLMIDDETKHIGQKNNGRYAKWEIRYPESVDYSKVFGLEKIPTLGAVLVLQNFDVGFSNPVEINGNFIGYMPGRGEEVQKWTDDVYLYIPPEYLKDSGNEIRIGNSSAEEYMIRNVRLVIEP